MDEKHDQTVAMLNDENHPPSTRADNRRTPARGVRTFARTLRMMDRVFLSSVGLPLLLLFGTISCWHWPLPVYSWAFYWVLSAATTIRHLKQLWFCPFPVTFWCVCSKCWFYLWLPPVSSLVREGEREASFYCLPHRSCCSWSEIKW